MAEEPDVIRHDIDRTRESLTEKVETLENTVKETIDTVKAKVEDTVETVSSTVEKTVDTVKRTFDIPYQVRRHPYGMAGGALAAGAFLGWWVGSRRAGSHRGYTPPPRSYAAAPTAFTSAAPGGPTGDGRTSQEPEGPGMVSRLVEPLAGEFDRIKATAIGALFGMARDFLVRSVPPSLAQNVEEIVDNITRHAGGEVIRGPILTRQGETGASFGRGANL
jgi:hypothetical protein